MWGTHPTHTSPHLRITWAGTGGDQWPAREDLSVTLLTPAGRAPVPGILVWDGTCPAEKFHPMPWGIFGASAYYYSAGTGTLEAGNSDEEKPDTEEDAWPHQVVYCGWVW